MKYKIISWVRDSKGKVVKRPLRDVCNTITTMCGGGHTAEDGMGGTTPYVLISYEGKDLRIERKV